MCAAPLRKRSEERAENAKGEETNLGGNTRGDKERNKGMKGQQGQRSWRGSMTEQAHPQRDCGPRRLHAGAEDTSKKEAAAEEKGEKEGEAERNRYVLTPIPCATHHVTEGTECNLGT